MPRLKVRDQEIQDARGHSGTFTGEIDPRSSLPDGHGIMIYPQNTTFSGDWEQGHYVKGTLTVGNNSTYTGNFLHSLPHGQGVIQYHKQGDIYKGEWMHGKKHGQGTFTWPGLEAYYKGEYRNNQRQGMGCYQTPNIAYTGEFQNGYYHGKGVLEITTQEDAPKEASPDDETPQTDTKQTRPAGKIVHQGFFQAGKPHGAGTEETVDAHGNIVSSRQGTWKQGQYQAPEHVQVVQDKPYGEKAVYRGIWDTKDDRPITGTLTFNDHSSFARYDGHFNENGNFEGEARLEYTNGDVYEGVFFKGHRHGLGTYQWKDGRVYKGGYSNNVREGYGTMLYIDGSRYEGEFCNNQRHGQGRFYFSDGSVFDGEWAQSEYRRGRLVHTNGVIYEGEFQGSVAHGYGKETSPLGKLSYEGMWHQGERAPSEPVENEDSYVVD